MESANQEELKVALARRTPPTDMSELQRTLAPLLPSLISVIFNPRGTSNELTATVRDIADKYGALTKGAAHRSQPTNGLAAVMSMKVGGPCCPCGREIAHLRVTVEILRPRPRFISDQVPAKIQMSQ